MKRTFFAAVITAVFAVCIGRAQTDESAPIVIKPTEYKVKDDGITPSLKTALPAQADFYDEQLPCPSLKTEACEAFYSGKSANGTQKEKTSALKNLLFIYLSDGRTDKAVETAENLVKQAPSDPVMSFALGWAYLSNGDYKKSVKQFESLRFITADYALVTESRIAMAQALMGEGKYEKAADILRALYTRDPYTISTTSYLLAVCHTEMKRAEMAAIFFQQSLTHDPLNCSAQIGLAQLFEKQKNNMSAWELYIAVLASDPDDEFYREKVSKLSKDIEGEKINKLRYSRLASPLNKDFKYVPSENIRVALFADRKGRPDILKRVEFIASSNFNVADSAINANIPGETGKIWSIVWNNASKTVDVSDSWGNMEHTARHQFQIKPAKLGGTILVKNVRGSDIAGRDYGDREVKGHIEIIPSDDGFIIVNVLSIEEYVPAVLSLLDKGDDISEEALKALAVAIRTKAAYLARKGRTAKYYDTCDSPACMSYAGMNMETPHASAAVLATKGQVLAKDRRLFNAEHHFTCGGTTENGIKDSGIIPDRISSPFSAVKRFIALPPSDILCASEDELNWTRVKWNIIMSADEISRRTERILQIGKLTAFRILERTPEGEVVSAEFVGKKGSRIVNGANDINFILAAGSMRSSFYWTLPLYKRGKLREIVIKGIGWGNRRGICVFGAGKLGRTKNYKDILEHYFPNAGIAVLNAKN